MFARRPVPTVTEQISRTLGIDRRIADLDAQVARMHANQDEADAEAQEQARLDAEYEALMEREADALADAIEAGDCDEYGEPIPYDTYRSAV